jgi:hypothetical protein
MVRRPRAARREQQRALRKEVRAREKLAAEAPGGSAEAAIVVASAALVEPSARSARCVQCGGELDVVAHDVAPGAPQVRVARVVCRLCHTPRRIWFRLEPPAAN